MHLHALCALIALTCVSRARSSSSPLITVIIADACDTCRYPVLSSHQRVFLVPGSFGSRVDPSKTLAQFETDMVNDANAFYAWAMVDPMV